MLRCSSFQRLLTRGRYGPAEHIKDHQVQLMLQAEPLQAAPRRAAGCAVHRQLSRECVSMLHQLVILTAEAGKCADQNVVSDSAMLSENA